jgi:hypothetical protein
MPSNLDAADAVVFGGMGGNIERFGNSCEAVDPGRELEFDGVTRNQPNAQRQVY